MNNELLYNSKFKPLFQPKEGVRYFIITGGRFSSKSYSVSTAVCCHVNNSAHRALYTRYTLNSAKDSIIPEFQEKIDLLNLTNYYNQTQDRIEGIGNKRKIVFKGIKTSSGNQTAKLKSLKDFSIFVLDEAEEENDEVSFDKINLSIRANDVPNYVILILNPTTKAHWIYNRFFEKSGIEPGSNLVKDNVCYIHTTYNDCIQFVPNDYLAEIENLKNTNPKKFEHIILGGWLDKADGVIYDNWEYGRFDESLPYGYGLDFGFFPDPDCLVKTAIDNKRKLIYVKEEWSGIKTPSWQLAKIISEKTQGKLVIADSSENRLIDDIKKAGGSIKPIVKTTVEEGIRLMRNYKIIVDHSSTEIAKELNNYCEKGGIPIDAFNHRLDAIRYYVTHFEYKPKQFKGHRAW